MNNWDTIIDNLIVSFKDMNALRPTAFTYNNFRALLLKSLLEKDPGLILFFLEKTEYKETILKVFNKALHEFERPLESFEA
jgi:hypothetical protein